jgi:DNA-binding winged helix-turn-helix (wHTH) protein/TolB-like protein/Tfp pilus assembly protein PilF
MLREEKELYEFGAFRLDVSEHTLSRSDGRNDGALPEKAFQTLCILVRNSGHLLTKERLMAEVWPDSFVEENNLDKCIHAIRQALGEKPGEQKYIETVRKHGYRFVAKATRIPGEVEMPERARKTDAERSQRSPVVASPRLILSGVGFLSAIFLIALLSFNMRSGASGSSDRSRSIAVLPLKPIGATARDELYEIGMADSLIHRLSLMKGFVVRPLSATRKYSDIDQDPLAAGQEQKVDYVLASNYQLADGKIRITTQLFNVAAGTVEENYKSEKDAGNIFALQDAVAGEIGMVLLARFAATEASRPKGRGTHNQEAYSLYLQAMHLLNGNKRHESSVQKAIVLLDQAVALDPDYAVAWAGRARAHYDNHFGRNVNLEEERQKADEAVGRALTLDENLPEAHSVLCSIKDSEQACMRAIELDPSSSEAHRNYSGYLIVRSRFDEAINEIKAAIDFDPAALFNHRLLGIAFYYNRRYAEAVEQWQRVETMDQEMANTYPWMVNTLAIQGKYDEAFKLYLESQSPQNAELLRAVYQTDGWPGIARERARKFEQDTYTRFFWGACLNADAGNIDKAFEYLERSYQRRERDMAYLQIEPRLDPLREDERFDAIVRRVGLR